MASQNETDSTVKGRITCVSDEMGQFYFTWLSLILNELELSIVQKSKL